MVKRLSRLCRLTASPVAFPESHRQRQGMLRATAHFVSGRKWQKPTLSRCLNTIEGAHLISTTFVVPATVRSCQGRSVVAIFCPRGQNVSFTPSRKASPPRGAGGRVSHLSLAGARFLDMSRPAGRACRLLSLSRGRESTLSCCGQ